MMPILLNYAVLKLFFWALIGFMLLAFVLTNGFDFGIGALLPFIGKKDTERRAILNVIGPHWDGNQVWLIAGGGALFAAWPLVYATAFSGLYIALLLVLWALFLRPVAIEYRSKIKHTAWRYGWDISLCIGSIVSTLIVGIALGNIFVGLPFHLDNDFRSFYTGSLLGLFNPFAVTAGLAFFSLIMIHGAAYLSLRSVGDIQQRAYQAVVCFSVAFTALFTLAAFGLSHDMVGYQVVSIPAHDQLLNPFMKVVQRGAGLWLTNYHLHPVLYIFPVLTYLSVFILLLGHRCKPLCTFLASAVLVISVLASAAACIFPFILPSSTLPNHSLTIWDATAAPQSLNILFIFNVLVVPVIIAYTFWVYRKMWGVVTPKHIEDNDKVLY